MKALDPNDQLYLFLESRFQPMHIAGLMLFELPEDAGDDYLRDLVAQAREHDAPVSPYNKRLVTRLGVPFWEYDDKVDTNVHVRHEALAAPGRVRELLETISAKHSTHLDPRRPLWEASIIEGLPNRRFAVYAKSHHALMDGVSAMRVILEFLSSDAEQQQMVPFWAVPQRRRRTVADANANVFHYLRSARDHASTVPTLLREALKQSRRAREVGSPSMFGAPPSILNQTVSGARRVAAQSYSMPRFQAIAKACRATVNDVVLAVCGSALRAYLQGQGALPDQPLIAMVPMSLRRDESAGGNLFATILANLGTHLADPIARMQVVKASVDEGKQRYMGMSPIEAVNYSALMLAPTALTQVTGLRTDYLPYNVLISNVPGSRDSVYWNRARMEAIYPLSLVLDRNALNITLISYAGKLNFGLVACREALPSMQRMLKHLQTGIEELEAALGIAPEVEDAGDVPFDVLQALERSVAAPKNGASLPAQPRA